MNDFMRQTVILQAKCELARRSFWEYNKLRYPNFYTDDKKYLLDISNTLQSFVENRLINATTGLPYDKLLLNAPPRHGKTLTLTNLVEWVLGKNNIERFICGSYNENLSMRFGKKIRDSIQEQKFQNNSEQIQSGANITKTLVYSDIFKDTTIKKGDASSLVWSLWGQYFNFLSTSPGGTVTGVGCSIGILDDLVKNKEEAYSELHLDKTWDWYTDTFLSRLEEGSKQIILMTRWAKGDVCGRILDSDEAADWYHLTFKAYEEKRRPQMLCSDILSKKSFEDKKLYMTPEIVEANYNQEPIDIKGILYKNLKTYDKPPMDNDGNLLFDQIRNYTDTADEGSDYLCSICYGVYNNHAYILDVLYTKEGMEVTEVETAKMLDENDVKRAVVESNNGGRGFARSVSRILKKTIKNNACYVKWFHQSNNKRARILSNATIVMNKILFPKGWEHLLPKFYRDVTTYQKEGKNKNDDAQDCLTGIAEDISRKSMNFG
jgi:predicted phage terminase large subunit-like protein